MAKEEKDKLNDNSSSDIDSKKENNVSFFNRLKQQVKIFSSQSDENNNDNITQSTDDVVLENELKKKEQEVKNRASELENARKKFEEEQKKIEEEHKRKVAERAEEERLEQERIAREKEEERKRIEAEKARKREEERLERERIEKEQAEKRRKIFRKKDKEFQLAEDKRKIEFLERENEKKEHENNLLALQTSLIAVDDKIDEKKLTIKKLKNRNSPKIQLTLEEKRLNTLLTQKQIIEKDIVAEQKLIERIQKNLELDHKLDGLKKEIYSIKKEVVNEDETLFTVKYKNKPRNIFSMSILAISAFVKKNIFRQKIENYPEIKKTSSNIKVKITTSFILAILLSLCFLVTLKFISSAKDHYVSFDDLQTTAVDTTDEMKKQKEAEEKAKILEAQEKANAARIDSDAQDEEITAKLAGTFVSYSFDVNREVTASKKIHTFRSANWSDVGDVIEAGTKFTVNKLVSPAGYMMYQISSGEHAGQFITANEKFVTVDKKNDQFSNFVSRPVAVKFLASQNVYTDQAISNVRVTMSNGAVLNISGYGISDNNRLIYHITDGSFIPVNPVRLTEVNRESAKSRNIDKEDNNSSNNQRNSTTQNTTQRNRSNG